MRTLLILAACTLLSGCSYLGSFLICNLSPAEIVVSYRVKKNTSYTGYFSNTPEIYELKMDDDEAELGKELSDIPYTVTSAITITVPAGKALRTGDDVNPSKESFAGLDRLMIIQGTDTTTISGKSMPSFVVDLGSAQEGLVIR
jgi:hypothetical protein